MPPTCTLLLALAAVADEPPERRWAAIAVPLVGYDSSMLLGLGAYGQVVVADPAGERPYRLSVDAQVYRTTGGWDDHFVGWDLPGAFGGPLRWDMRLRYQRWTAAPYYGVGNDAVRAEPGAEPPRWTRWASERPFVWTHLRVPLGPRGPVEAYTGLLWSWIGVTAHPDSQLATEAPVGVDGGAVGTVTVGLFRDTRTDEIDPTDGTALDLAARIALPRPLSDYAWGGGHASLRGWWSATERVVVAGHAVVDANAGQVPFFEQAIWGGLQRTGIGGRYLLRGLSEERLRGDALAATQAELRFRLGWVTVLRRLDLGFAAAPFVDAAQVVAWDDPDPRVAPWVTAGGGLRVNLNGLLILRFDVGVGAERYAVEPTARPQVQVYMLAAQPF